MSRRHVAGAVLIVGALAGCAAPDQPTTTVGSPPPSAARTDPGPPDAAALMRCLTDAVPGGKVVRLPDAPPGGTAAIAVDVARPDLPKGVNRVTVATFSAASAAASFADGSGTFVGGTGGTSDAVGDVVVTRTFAGDDAVVEAAKSCAVGS